MIRCLAKADQRMTCSADPSQRRRNAGFARAASLTPERRSEIARAAALARWRGTAVDSPLVKFDRKVDSKPDHHISITVTIRVDYVPSKGRSHELAANALFEAARLVRDGATAGDHFDKCSGHVGTFQLLEWTRHDTGSGQQSAGLVAARKPAAHDDGAGTDQGS